MALEVRGHQRGGAADSKTAPEFLPNPRIFLSSTLHLSSEAKLGLSSISLQMLSRMGKVPAYAGDMAARLEDVEHVYGFPPRPVSLLQDPLRFGLRNLYDGFDGPVSELRQESHISHHVGP